MLATATLQGQRLEARDQRAYRQRKLIDLYDEHLIVLTLNLPGTTAMTKSIRELHTYAMTQLRQRLMPYQASISYIEVAEDAIGPIGIIVINQNVITLKAMTIEMEESDMYGRLFDIDVVNTKGEQISRKALNQEPRLCFLCEEEANDCRRQGRHTPEAINLYIEQMVQHFEAIMKMRQQHLSVNSDD